MTLRKRLSILLGHLPAGAQLDHDPALILRPFNERTGKYTPDANDPAYLIYRDPADHLQKTTGRKPGAERTITTKGSDIGLKTKFARLERKSKRKPRTTITPKGYGKIPSRQFQVGIDDHHAEEQNQRIKIEVCGNIFEGDLMGHEQHHGDEFAGAIVQPPDLEHLAEDHVTEDRHQLRVRASRGVRR